MYQEKIVFSIKINANIAQYLKLCREYALSQVDKQREDFKRLGVSGDWENPYVTLTPDYEAAQRTD